MQNFKEDYGQETKKSNKTMYMRPRNQGGAYPSALYLSMPQGSSPSSPSNSSSIPTSFMVSALSWSPSPISDSELLLSSSNYSLLPSESTSKLSLFSLGMVMSASWEMGSVHSWVALCPTPPPWNRMNILQSTNLENCEIDIHEYRKKLTFQHNSTANLHHHQWVFK